jgi:LemA protein
MEDQIGVTRNLYAKSIRDYNIKVRSFPYNLTASVFGYEKKPQFEVGSESELKVAPKVEFGK